MTGQLIAHYHVGEKLGEGGMGAVFKARDTHLDRFVALKILPAERVSDPDRRRRFVLEARAASALNHPNIVTIHDVASDGDVHFIAMEYVGGRTLAELVSVRRPPMREVLAYAIQIADALATAHDAGIVHRDLKPANLMLTETGNIKVLDFGLAKLTEDARISVATVEAATMSGADRLLSGIATIVGTAGYMSPEQVEGRKVDARSDIFAFGAVLYELTTGRRAFVRDSMIATLSAILQEHPPAASDIVPGIPRGMARLIARCLEKNPGQRFQHMADVRIALQDLREDLEAGPPASTARDTARRRWFVSWLVVAAMVGTAAAAGLAIWRWPRSADPIAQPLSVVPLTTYPGSELSPSLSPDGNQVAFTWNGERQDNFDVYVKLVGPGVPLRLTTDPMPDTNPAWSPDGRWIAFLRVFPGGRGALILVPALGGVERRLADVVGSPFLVDSIGRALAWSPDSTTLVAAADGGGGAPPGLFAFSVATGERRRVTSLPPRAWIDTGPAFSPDGRVLAFTRFVSFGISDLYGLALDGKLNPVGEASRLTSQNRFVNGPAWAPDGRRIVFSSGSLMTGVERLFALDASATTSAARLPPRITPFGERGAFGSIVRVAPANRSRMVYSQSHSDTGIWRIDLRGDRVPTPGERQSEPFILSTQMEYLPQYSPDGGKVAFVSLASGAAEIWVCDKDGANLVQLTSTGWPETAAPRWSPDGSHLVFQARREGTADLFSMPATGGVPIRVTDDPADDWGGTWSRDGRWIYFGSNRSGRFEIWKTPVENGPATQVTRNGGYGPSVSPDGRHVYFMRRFELWRVTVDSGEEQRLLDTVSDWSRFAVTSSGIYFTPGIPLLPGSPAETAIEFLDFETRTVRRILRPDKALYIGMAVSPDERSLLLTQFDQGGADLMLIDDFRW
jgi:Tol biopolymer transport system component